ncbi:hypothetical protein [Paenibacillus eucommiae]|uniref:Uncharacterized protein n=1 Tax=Paenibacillus eucommiae TaxID=1355755 RepID=A0ABS4J001_9BACL|nr:hypothetical protein [Paenibacillus eucommiae]MBP1993168.1 hypothetical protein [Paenibacillus eucommiae]
MESWNTVHGIMEHSDEIAVSFYRFSDFYSEEDAVALGFLIMER